MKHFVATFFGFSLSLYANVFENIESFQAEFLQKVTDDKNTTLTYDGELFASKPHSALWRYTKPLLKELYINSNTIVVIEPELEQAIKRSVPSHLDFFAILKSAKEHSRDFLEARYNEYTFLIEIDGTKIRSIAYRDEFDNSVKIEFKKQKIDEAIESSLFIPKIPASYDIIEE